MKWIASKMPSTASSGVPAGIVMLTLVLAGSVAPAGLEPSASILKVKVLSTTVGSPGMVFWTFGW